VDALKEIWQHETQRRKGDSDTLEGFENEDVFDVVFPEGFDVGYLST
jgi:hypothetical protein